MLVRVKPTLSLQSSASSGVKWTGLSALSTSCLHLVEFTILSRLLLPEDFGLAAMTTVALNFAQIFADFGISNAVIHRQDVTENQLSSLFWLNILGGILVFGFMIAATPVIASLYGEPRLGNLMLWAALIFLITPMGQQSQVLLQKELQFFHLSLAEILSGVIGAAIAVGCALGGHGVLSLIWGRISQVLSRTVMLICIGWKKNSPKLHFSRSDLHGYIGFGLYQMGERSINYFNSHLDQMLIGSILGAEALGYYNLAFNLVVFPSLKINPILTRVAFPILARIQSDNHLLKRAYLLVLEALSTINFPFLLGIAAAAPILVPVAFGPEWSPSVGLIQILAIVALLRSMGNPVGSLLLAKGRADLGFNFNVMKLTIQVPGIYLGAHLGELAGIAYALLAIQTAYSALGYLFLVRTLLGACLREYLASMTPALVLSTIMAVIVGSVSMASGKPTLSLLIIQLSGGTIAYLVLTLLFRRQELGRIRHALAAC